VRKIDLNGQWEMKRIDETQWMRATVPGSVYSALLDSGLMQDPFYRENEAEALELSGFDYEYRRSFEVNSEWLNMDAVYLLCEGLDTLSTVRLNDRVILDTDNMHRVYEADVKALLRSGTNELHILFRSPLEYVRRMHKERPLLNSNDAVEGISHLRKAHCMFGWDWGPKLPDMGIWRDISLRAYNQARLEDVYVVQSHSDDRVDLDVRIRMKHQIGKPCRVSVAVIGPDGMEVGRTEMDANGDLPAGMGLSAAGSGRMGLSASGNAPDRNGLMSSSEIHAAVTISNPQLWWPNNLGAQPLYTVRVVLIADPAAPGITWNPESAPVLDERVFRIGLRTLTVRKEKDQWGESFDFTVNGVGFFSMGADYIPEDNILSRCSRDRTEFLIKSCVEANFNSIRVWGGAYYPEDWFYDLCDEYGLVVWQDLMYACGVYELTDSFVETITQETIDNMKRLRHHASLGLWCGNNEQEVAWVEWGWSRTQSLKLKADYIKMYEYILPKIAKEIDPNTFYWLASPSSTGSFDNPNDENRGDMHFWGVWHGLQPFTDYRKIFPRYMSEFGLQSYPGLKTVESFTLPEDRNIFSSVMESHQKNVGGNAKILYYISENYRYPKDFDSLLYASQLIQAEGLRYGVEHWRQNRGRCMGAIYWQLNDCWPVASWASVDYFGRWKALHYTAKRFFAPVMASACEEGSKVSLHVSNERRYAVSGRLFWRLMLSDSTVLEEGEKLATMHSMTTNVLAMLDFGDYLTTKDMLRSTYLEFGFESDGEPFSGGTVLFCKAKHFHFEHPEIRMDITEHADRFSIHVISSAFVKFVGLELKEADAIFSDNFFDLSAGTKKIVEVKKERLSKPMTLDDMKAYLTVRSLVDTY